ncbi:DEBR0S2_13586g1_1 [Brettanomyces bruxellensis]|uniref:DEBR0S2_13586g1_1 n=1 Tax=Dekkera bruxellensis TaxID=5007 RepID=A0A7D9CX75_DEKBR|nr:DEBR0S2_13586g1_1 [Brettanomyces bruxellensis]
MKPATAKQHNTKRVHKLPKLTNTQLPSSSTSKSTWNIIKNPLSGRTRISQACDRCRARKIKCSGKSEMHPRCTNCKNDGFQCIVSDKLARNSFPKGYTKNLEKKLLDVELERNKLTLELKAVKKQLEAAQQMRKLPSDQHTDPFSGRKITNLVKSQSKSSIKTNHEGLFDLEQFIVFPFNKLLQRFHLKSFSSYNPSKSKKNIDKSQLIPNESNAFGTKEDPEMEVLQNYHMNLNRYLNLILYKLILPSFSAGTSDSRGKLSSSGSRNNLDHLIWLFFNIYNKLIPILDFELFYNDYLTFINKYTLQKSTYVENGETKRRYYTFSLKEQDLLIKLILILKFTLAEPRGSFLSSIPNFRSFNQLEESIKLINLKNLKLMFGNINFSTDISLDKVEIALLLFYYLVKFENYNVFPQTQIGSGSQGFKANFLRDVIQLCISLVKNLHLDSNASNIVLGKSKCSNSQLIKIQRLKLYWDYRILMKLTETYFNINLNSAVWNFDDSFNEPESLESIHFVCTDIEVTLQLVNLLKITPINVLNPDGMKDSLKTFDESMQEWCKGVEAMKTEDNNTAILKLKTYYYYFMIVTHLDSPADVLSKLLMEYMEIAYELVFSGKNFNLNLENAENLCMHSFNFHLLCLIGFLVVGNGSTCSETLKSKMMKIFNLYEFLVTVKYMDPVLCDLIEYIKHKNGFGGPTETSFQENLDFLSYSLGKPSSSTFQSGVNSFREMLKQKDQGSFEDMSFQFPAEINYGRNGRNNSKQIRSCATVYNQPSPKSTDTSITAHSVPSLFSSGPYQRVQVKKEMDSIDLKTRSLSVDTTALMQNRNVSDKAPNEKIFSRCQSENGTNNVMAELEPNGQVKLPVSLSGFLNEMNNFKSGSSEPPIYPKENSTLPTIPSESNLEASLAQAERMASSANQLDSIGGFSMAEPRTPHGVPFRDSDDLIKLKERVMNMRATMKG